MEEQAREMLQMKEANAAREKEYSGMMQAVNEKLEGEDAARAKMQENVE